MQGAFYATPIIYPLTAIPENVGKVLLLSPVAQIIQDLHYLLITPQSPTIGTVYHNEWMRLIPLSIVLVFTVIALYYFRKRSRYFAEEI